VIVDSSAIICVLTAERERERFVDALLASPYNGVSAGTWIELSAVIVRRFDGLLFEGLDILVSDARLVIEPVTASQARIGRDAYRTYGIGSGHPARLNFGDCFAYALAKETGQPLLFKGDDFARTDITPALR
jgi:ribonuclease VapC